MSDPRPAAPSLFRPLLPAGVVLAEMSPADADPAALPPEERALVARAVEKRRREFAAGRQLARAAFAEAGVAAAPLLSDPDRVPRWPAGVTGSITHCASLCAVAVAPVSACAGLGLDVEPAAPLDARLLPMILREAEFARIEALPPTLRPFGGLLAFSIKEAVYKAIYPSRRTFLEFRQVEVAFVGEDGFVAEVLVPEAAPPGRARIHGRFRIADGHVGAAVVLPAD